MIRQGWSFALLGVAWGMTLSTGHTRLMAGEASGDPLQVAEARRLAVIHQAMQATICIFSATDDSGGGSGVILTPDGLAITNFHVTAPCGDYLRCGVADGKLYDAVIVGVDPTGDVAMIKLLGLTDFPTVTWGNSDAVRAGDSCFAVGNPFALATDFQPSVTAGIISGVHRYQEPSGTLIEYTDCLQTDASVNPGNSGGPLFNMRGELIGINGRCSFEKRGRVNVGVAYAISSNQVQRFWGNLLSGRIVDHATAGFTVSTRTDGGAVVSNILRTSDAFRRGIRDGDLVVAFDSRPVDSANAFKNILGTIPQGWRVPMTVLRDAERVEYFVRLEGVHAREELLQLLESGAMGLGPERPEGEPPPRQPAPHSPDGGPDSPPAIPNPDNPNPQEDNPHSATAAGPMPPEVAAWFEARRGYANYAFNRQQRDRVWQRVQQFHHALTSEIATTWQLTAQHKPLGNVEITLQPENATARYSSGRQETFVASRSESARDKPDFLSGLYLFHKLLTLGPTRFGEVYYLGQSPWPGQDTMFDVLVGTHEALETHFYVHPATGQIVGMEVYPDIEVDPLEFWLESNRDSPLGNLPTAVRIQWGNQEPVRLEGIEWSTHASQPKESS